VARHAAAAAHVQFS